MKDQIPSEKDWAGCDKEPESRYAYRIFLGKTNEEMQESFRENVLERVEDLRWMPAKPFRYYMIGFRDYVMSGEFGFYDEADASCCFLELIIQKLEGHPDHILPILPDLMDAAEYVGTHQQEYDADEDIYGSYPQKLSTIKKFQKLLENGYTESIQ